LTTRYLRRRYNRPCDRVHKCLYLHWDI